MPYRRATVAAVLSLTGLLAAVPIAERATPDAVLAGNYGVALADAAGSAALIQFFLGDFATDRSAVLHVALRALPTAVAAPLVLALARKAVALGGGDVDVRREMRLETKRPVL